MSISIQEETCLESFIECIELSKHHYEEVEPKHKELPFNPDWDQAKAMVDHNLISVVTVRDEGVLVGYYVNAFCVDFINSQLSARDLGIYIDPKYRGGKTFLKLYKFTIDLLKSKGMRAIYMSFKKDHNEKLPLKLGFERTETTYMRIL